MTVVGLRVEHGEPTLGVGEHRPRLSWRVETETPAWLQVAYRVEAHDADDLRSVWTSGVVTSATCRLVPWGGPDLVSRQRVRWRVTVDGNDGRTETSEWATFEVGLLDADDWTAELIVPDAIEPADPTQPAALLRGEFDVPDGIARARLTIAALGVVEVECNGAVVGDHVLDPGWSSYPTRLRYAVHDLDPLLRPGRNALGVRLADGWYGERYGFNGNRRRIYGDELAVIAQVELLAADGRRHRSGTDLSWRSATGPTTASGIYLGEHHDARLEPAGWSTAGFEDAGWSGVHGFTGERPSLVARRGPPVRRIETVSPVAVSTSPSGEKIYDFGQNLVGRLRLALAGPGGTVVTLRHAELLEDGELCTEPLRTAEATDHLTLAGGPPESWEPRFTFHGFRYAGLRTSEPIVAPDVTAVVLHTDAERTGWFDSSSPLVDRLHENVVWGMRGNFLDVPTDCPQRDERLGWTGDLAVFAPAATLLADVHGMLAGWLDDLAAEQTPDGLVPLVVPDIIGMTLATAVWGDAAVTVPWALFQRYGDDDLLRRCLPMMRAWTDAVVARAGDERLWLEGFQLGDWVDPSAPPDRPGEGRTNPHLVAQAAFVNTLHVMSRAVAVAGTDADANRYQRVRDEAAAAFRRAYVAESRRLTSDSPAAYALAIAYGVFESDDDRAAAGVRLAELVAADGYRIGTGFAGTPVLLDALCATGHDDVAFAVLEQTECPSWLYTVNAGATTIWERWDGIRPDGTRNPGEMNSFNHYAFGAVADWLHRRVAGLSFASPGGAELRIHVAPGGSFTAARSRIVTPHGPAEVAWKLGDDAASLDVTAEVPPNSRAVVSLPGRPDIDVGSGFHRWRVPYPPLDSTHDHLPRASGATDDA